MGKTVIQSMVLWVGQLEDQLMVPWVVKREGRNPMRWQNKVGVQGTTTNEQCDREDMV